MKLLLDQDVYAATARWLHQLGHDIVLAAEIDCASATDSELLCRARELERILVTRDRDFGQLVFVAELRTGVIYLRVLPSTVEATHKELETVLVSHSEDELRNAFVVVEPGRHRLRRLAALR